MTALVPTDFPAATSGGPVADCRLRRDIPGPLAAFAYLLPPIEWTPGPTPIGSRGPGRHTPDRAAPNRSGFPASRHRGSSVLPWRPPAQCWRALPTCELGRSFET